MVYHTLAWRMAFPRSYAAYFHTCSTIIYGLISTERDPIINWLVAFRSRRSSFQFEAIISILTGCFTVPFVVTDLRRTPAGCLFPLFPLIHTCLFQFYSSVSVAEYSFRCEFCFIGCKNFGTFSFSSFFLFFFKLLALCLYYTGKSIE